MDRLRHALTIATLVAVGAGSARADHDHGAHGGHGGDAAAPGVSVSIGVLAARYRSTLFAGDYQGTRVGAAWSAERLAIAAAITGYRITRNGKAYYGPGDVSLAAEVTIVRAPRYALGASAGLSAPTGSERDGMGMGHVMAMASGWARWSPGPASVTAALGYGRVLGGRAAHAEHGSAWPLVDPMSGSELTFAAAAEVPLAAQLRAGVAIAGAVPVPAAEGERARLTAAMRAVVTTGRVETSAELGAGLLGDPYVFRGSIACTVRF
jgi:hypothetical protein